MSNNILEEIVACAFKDTDGKIYISRMCHAEIISMFYGIEDKEIEHRCEQGFITNLNRFVDRKEALKIAKNAKQELHKRCPSDELYSEDIFYDLFEENKIKKQEKVIDLMANFINECFLMSPGRVSRALREHGFNDDKCVEEKCTENDTCTNCIKQFFEKKASEENGI